MEREIRNGVEIRALQDDSGLIIEGYAAVFDKPTELWSGMYEVIRRGAFKRTLDHGADVRLLFNHDPNLVFARSKSGTLQLSEDEKGLKYRATLDPNDTDAANLHRRIMRGSVDQSSFAFSIEKNGENFTDHEGGRMREVKAAKLFDVSPVTYPAYKDTEVMARTAFRNAPDNSETIETETEQAAPEPAFHAQRNRNRQMLAEINIRRKS